ncbi:unnamed protein product [Cuscuta epithymum]|uniref:Uncharacterized protein n=1 Tax=Cuscuta epithymum TaxID=186058 RepID=A0AAV0CAE8_9ASTE|nr:unnamed protein product [Cuscuta epithymum]
MEPVAGGGTSRVEGETGDQHTHTRRRRRGLRPQDDAASSARRPDDGRDRPPRQQHHEGLLQERRRQRRRLPKRVVRHRRRRRHPPRRLPRDQGPLERHHHLRRRKHKQRRSGKRDLEPCRSFRSLRRRYASPQMGREPLRLRSPATRRKTDRSRPSGPLPEISARIHGAQEGPVCDGIAANIHRKSSKAPPKGGGEDIGHH